MLTNLPETPCGYLTTSSPGATTSRTKQSAGSVRVVPHTQSAPPLSRHTPRWMPGCLTAGASRASASGASARWGSKVSGRTARAGGRKASEIVGV